MGKIKRAAFADDVRASTGGEIKRILPSHVRADHSHNTSRWQGYDAPAELAGYFKGAKICFTLAQIERKLATLKAEGQIDPVDISISGTGHPDLVKGFLRHCAFLLAEVRGELEDIPGAKGLNVTGIRAQVVPAPKTQADFAAIARRNLAENREREEMTPVDVARYLKGRLASFADDGTPVTLDVAAAEIGLKKRAAERYLQLFTLRPETILAVHEGRLAMSRAIKQASEKGEGTARGAVRGVRRAAMRRRKVEQRPSTQLTPEQVDSLIDALNGDLPRADCDDVVAAYVSYFDAPAEPKESKKPRKKAPPKHGEAQP